MNQNVLLGAMLAAYVLPIAFVSSKCRLELCDILFAHSFPDATMCRCEFLSNHDAGIRLDRQTGHDGFCCIHLIMHAAWNECMQCAVVHGLSFLSKQMQHSVSWSITTAFGATAFGATASIALVSRGHMSMCVYMVQKTTANRNHHAIMTKVWRLRTVMPILHIEALLYSSCVLNRSGIDRTK